MSFSGSSAWRGFLSYCSIRLFAGVSLHPVDDLNIGPHFWRITPAFAGDLRSLFTRSPQKTSKKFFQSTPNYDSGKVSFLFILLHCFEVLRLAEKRNSCGECQDSCRLFSLCRFETEVLFRGPFSFRVEPNDFDWLPVPYLSRPTTGVFLPGLLVHLSSLTQFNDLSPRVTIIWRYEADLAMQMHSIVPMYECINPSLRPVFGGKGP